MHVTLLLDLLYATTKNYLKLYGSYDQHKISALGEIRS